MSEAGRPEDDEALAQTRAALAPTLAATAAILPWLARPKAPRFPPELDKRWQATCERLKSAWSDRYGEGMDDFRPAVFALCATALELADVDCLNLSEAFATATDRLDDPASLRDVRLVAALSAGVECLNEPGGLESSVFTQRARNIAKRLEECANTPNSANLRSPTINRLFVAEAIEYLERINEAFEMFPTDAYGAREAALAIVLLAEPLELDGVVNIALRLAGLLSPQGGEIPNFDDENIQAAAHTLIEKLDRAIAEVDRD